MVKIGEIVMILDLHRQGLSVSAIARQSGIDRKTVRKYIERGLAAPVYGPRKPRETVIDPFKRHVLAGHRVAQTRPRRPGPKTGEIILHGSGDRVVQRPLAFYDAVARAMAREQRP